MIRLQHTDINFSEIWRQPISFQKSLKRYPTQIWRQNRASAAKTKTNDFILWRRNVCNSCPVFLAAPLCELSRDQRNQGAKDVSKEAKHWEAFQLVCEVFLGKMFEFEGNISESLISLTEVYSFHWLVKMNAKMSCYNNKLWLVYRLLGGQSSPQSHDSIG